MVPKIHAKGTSFKGAAAYLLHDKERAKTSARVGWVEMRNLLTDDADTGWRVMAATAMDQDRLKELAGVKSTGRKSNASVLHLTLAWHPDEKQGLTKDEMIRAANAAIRAIEAGDRQAMIIHHTDEEHPHVHILINRVSSDDGRMLSSSKEKLNLSKWAQAYEKERGTIYCEERVLNNDARDRGQYTRGQKDQARHIYELAPANDNTPAAKSTRAEQKSKDAAVAKKVRADKSRHRKQWQDLQQRHRQRETAIKAQSLMEATRSKGESRARYRPEHHQLLQEHQAELRHFLNNEKSFLGRAANALRSIDFRALVGGRSIEPDRRQSLSQAFGALSSSGARLEKMKQRMALQKREIETREARAENDIDKRVRATRRAALHESQIVFERERNDLILGQKLEGAKHRTDWKTRNEQRSKAWESGQQDIQTRKPVNAALLAEARALMDKIKRTPRSVSKDHDRDRERDD